MDSPLTRRHCTGMLLVALIAFLATAGAAPPSSMLSNAQKVKAVAIAKTTAAKFPQPAAPKVTVEQWGPSAVKVSWQPPANLVAGQQMVLYRIGVGCNPMTGACNASEPLPANYSSFVMTDVPGDSSPTFYVVGRDNRGQRSLPGMASGVKVVGALGPPSMCKVSFKRGKWAVKFANPKDGMVKGKKIKYWRVYCQDTTGPLRLSSCKAHFCAGFNEKGACPDNTAVFSEMEPHGRYKFCCQGWDELGRTSKHCAPIVSTNTAR